MSDVYTHIAKATRTNREDVKKILHAAALNVMRFSVELEGGNGGSYVRVSPEANGMLYLEVGESCVVTVKQKMSVRALAAILTHAHDIGFEKFIEDYLRKGGGQAAIPIDRDLP